MSIGPLFLRRLSVSISYKQKPLRCGLFLRAFSPSEIMNPMNIKSTSFLFLLMMAILPALGQVSAPYNNRYDGSVKDEQAHIDAKTKWIKEHPEEYRKAGGDPESVLNANEPAKPAADHAKATPLPPFSADKRYKLTVAEVVVLPGKRPAPELIKRESEGLKSDFIDQEFELQIGQNDQIRLFSAQQLDLRAIQKRSGNTLEWAIENKGCPTCSKQLRLIVEQESPTRLVYLMESEDADASFAYRLTFTSTH